MPSNRVSDNGKVNGSTTRFQGSRLKLSSNMNLLSLDQTVVAVSQDYRAPVAAEATTEKEDTAGPTLDIDKARMPGQGTNKLAVDFRQKGAWFGFRADAPKKVFKQLSTFTLPNQARE